MPARGARLQKPWFENWFEEIFTQAYPENRRCQKAGALAQIRKLKPTREDATAIIARLELWKASEGWLEDGGKYIPGMGNFFKNGFYQRQPPTLNGSTMATVIPFSDLVKQQESRS